MAEDEVSEGDGLVREAEHEVRMHRDRRDYPADLLDRLESPLQRDAAAGAPEALAYIPSARPLVSQGPMGAVSVAVKRAVRRALAWYVHPITVDQSRFNESIINVVRKLERRVQRMETPWLATYDPDDPLRQGLAAARSAILRNLLSNGGQGAVLVLGAGTELGATLGTEHDNVMTVNADPIDALSRWEAASLSGVYLAGVLSRVSATDVINVFPLVATKLRPGGWVAADEADPRHPRAPEHAATLDIGVQRWLLPDTVTRLLEVGGLSNARIVELNDVDGTAAWYAVVAEQG